MNLVNYYKIKLSEMINPVNSGGNIPPKKNLPKAKPIEPPKPVGRTEPVDEYIPGRNPPPTKNS